MIGLTRLRLYWPQRDRRPFSKPGSKVRKSDHV